MTWKLADKHSWISPSLTTASLHSFFPFSVLDSVLAAVLCCLGERTYSLWIGELKLKGAPTTFCGKSEVREQPGYPFLPWLGA